MTPRIPFGGFLACQNASNEAPELMHHLESSGAQVCHIKHADLVMAGWTEFPGQGLWQSNSAVVAYDLNLTNQAELKEIAEIPVGQTCDPGELLWRLYQRLGRDFIDKLRGAFAFALWDNTENTLLVVTDFFGIRPVVYTDGGRGFAAASRIRQLAHVGIDKQINPEAIYHYLFFQAICSPVSIYRDINKLEPGMGLEVKKGQVRPWTHYDIRYQPQAKDEAHWCKSIPEELERAIGRYVPQDDEEQTGCFLSGGTDSSTIVGYYSKLAKQPARTFSIGFDDQAYNELGYARLAVDHFGTEQHEYMVTAKDVLNLIDHLPHVFDEPFGNASVVAAYFCAQLAGEHGVKVMLGGDGGDEVFGGNERYVQNLVFQRYQELPAALRKSLIEPLLSVMPSIGVLHKVKRYVRRSNIPNPNRFYSYNLLAETDNRQIFQPDFLASIDTGCFMAKAADLYERAHPAHDTDRLLYIDMKHTITDNDLRKVTQMVEAAGLQAHYPLLDRDLVDFSGQIPPQLKVQPGRNRYIFKKSLSGFLPEQIIHKSKHGMGLPIAKWLKEVPELREMLNDTVFSSESRIRNIIKGQYLDKLKQAFEGDQTAYYGDNLWVFLMLEKWLRSSEA